MGDVLIDLGEVSDPTTPAAHRPPVPHRYLLGVLSLLLLFPLAGATHRGPPDPPTIIPAGLGDTMSVSADRVFVISAGSLPAAAADRIVSAYALPSGRLISRTPVEVSGSAFTVVSTGGVLLLLSFQTDAGGSAVTVAQAEGTGRALWRTSARLLAVSPADRLVLLRQDGDRLGRETWTGVDLTTGRVRWTVRPPTPGLTTAAGWAGGFPRFLVTAAHTGEIEVRDTRTGALTGRARVPVGAVPVAGDVPVWPLDDLVLVGAPGGSTAYTLPGLVRRWHSAADLTGRWVQSECETVICTMPEQGGVATLDPATGRPGWTDLRWTDVEQAGPYLLASDSSGNSATQQLAVLDPRTGRVRGSFGRWNVGAVRPDGTVIGLHEQSPDGTIWYADLDPATRAIRPLGRADRVSGDCQVGPGALVCRRIDASVGIWPLK